MQRPNGHVRSVVGVGLVLAMVALGGSGCRRGGEEIDPCQDVACPTGEVCEEGECVPASGACETDADCPETTPICDGGACRTCTGDAECGEGRHCDGDGLCADSPIACIDDGDCPGTTRPYCDLNTARCVGCTRDTHCPGLGQVCDRSLGECMTPTSCNSDTDCADDRWPRCAPGSGTCVACLADGDCDTDARQTCDTSTYTCQDFVPCVRDSDCAGRPDAPRCALSTGECVACLSEADCLTGTGRTCDTEAGSCIGGVACAVDGTCTAAGYARCDTRIGLCVDCLGSDDCVDNGATCDVQNRACRPPVLCDADGDCDGTPTPICDDDAGFCVECLTEDDCGSDYAVCVGGVCDDGPPRDGRAGSSCVTGPDCDAGGYFNVCFGEWDLGWAPDDWQWFDGYCSAFCDANDPCGPGSVCLGNVCWRSCADASHCRPGYRCLELTDGLTSAGVCTPQCDPAVVAAITCTTDADCGLGVCDVGAGQCTCSAIGGRCDGEGFCGPGAECLLEETADGPTGWEGGYCIKLDCDPPAVPCPSGSSCYNVGGGTACLPDCDPNSPSGCDRAPYGCSEVLHYVLGGSCFADADCPSSAPNCYGPPGEAGTCIRACDADDDCDVDRGHVCTNINRQIFLCADPFQSGVCFPGCKSDADCGGCLADDDCAAGQVCDGGSCRRACSSSGQCEAGQACLGGYCARPCTDATDCPRGADCVGGACTAVPYLCDPVTRRCDPPCATDIDCDRTRSCDSETGRCETLCDDAADDCGPAGRCNLDEMLCEVDCRNLTGFCGADQYCDVFSGECQPRCGDFGEGTCPTDLRCDVLTGECVTPCADTARPCTFSTVEDDCEAGEVCRDGYCAASCSADEQCPVGMACYGSRCTSPTCQSGRWYCDADDTGLCFACFRDTQCAASRYCDVGGTYTCTERCGGVNGGNLSCPTGQICDVEAGGLCAMPCVTSEDCTEADRPYCQSATGLCGACALDDHCEDPERSVCDADSRTCVECRADTDCDGHPGGPACDVATGTCLPCIDDDHCEGHEDGPRCLTGEAVCVACLEDDDCPDATPLCDTETWTCAGCADDADCRGTDVCHPGVAECHPPCGELPFDRTTTGFLDTEEARTFVDADGNLAQSFHFTFQDGDYAFSAETDIFTEASFSSFAFTVPGDATITGIAVSAVAATTGDSEADAWEVRAQLRDAEGLRGEARSAALTPVDTRHVLGGDSDPWGDAWTPAEVNASDFGLRLVVADAAVSAVDRARVDHLTVTVFYTLPGGTDCEDIEDEVLLYCGEDNRCDVDVEG
jgi:hypothetical protein